MDAYTDFICGEPVPLLNIYNFYETDQQIISISNINTHW
jgi:hypothetical protein